MQLQKHSNGSILCQTHHSEGGLGISIDSLWMSLDICSGFHLDGSHKILCFIICALLYREMTGDQW